MEPQEQTLDLRDLLWMAQRYGWLIALPIIACLCVAAVYFKHTTPLYTSQILVSVEGNTQASPTLDPMVGAFIERANPRERVAVVDSKIHSRAFLAILVERLGMNRNPAILARARLAAQQWKGITVEEYAMRVSVTRLGKKFSVSPGRGSLVAIAAIDTDPEAARQLAEMIGDVLVEESLQSTLERGQARGEFSRDQIAVYEDRLRKSEEALRAFQESTLRKGFSLGIITDQNLVFARSLERSTEDAIEQLRTRIEAAKGDWRTIMGDAPIPELTSSRISEMTGLLSDLEINDALAVLRGGTETRTESDRLQARVAAARQALFAEFGQAAQTTYRSYPAEAKTALAGIALDRAVLRSLRDRADRVASEVEIYLKSVEGSPRDAMELQRLKQDVETNRSFLASLRMEARSSQVSEALAISALGPRLNIVEHPLLPLSPFSPEPRKIFGVALLVGPLLAAGIVFAGERFASVLRTTQQAEAEYGRPVLGTVPRVEGWSRPGSFLRNNWAALAVVLVLLVTGLVFAIDAAQPASQPSAGQILGLLP